MHSPVQFSIRHLLLGSIVAALLFGAFRVYLLRLPEEQRFITALSALTCVASTLISLAAFRWFSNRSCRRGGDYLFSAALSRRRRIGSAIAAMLFGSQAIFQLWIAFDLANWISFFSASIAGVVMAFSIAMLLTKRLHFFENGIVVSGTLFESIDIDMTAEQDRVQAKLSIGRKTLTVLISSSDASLLTNRWAAS